MDNCDELLGIVSKSYPTIPLIKADVSDVLDDFDNLVKLGLYSRQFDSIISIAVIHHLSTESRRIQMIKNIYNLLKPGGTCLISTWATTFGFGCKSNKKLKRIGLETMETMETMETNEYSHDYLIMWNNQFERYYHLFEPDELELLISKAGLENNIIILEKIFECDNWIIKLKKL